MARLPDPTTSLSPEERAGYDHIAEVRGEGAMLEAYHRLFNHPAVAIRMGELGELLRFRGELPDDVRELIVLRVAQRMGVAYEWGHHVGPAREAGVADDVIDAIEAGERPGGLRPEVAVALDAADAVFDYRSVPQEVHDALVDAFGVRGVVEVAALVGIYRMMGGMIAAFDIELEPGFPRPSW